MKTLQYIFVLIGALFIQFSWGSPILSEMNCPFIFKDDSGHQFQVKINFILYGGADDKPKNFVVNGLGDVAGNVYTNTDMSYIHYYRVEGVSGNIYQRPNFITIWSEKYNKYIIFQINGLYQNGAKWRLYVTDNGEYQLKAVIPSKIQAGAYVDARSEMTKCTFI